MSDQKHCAQCGAVLPPDAPGGHCLNCLLQLGLSASEPAGKPGDRIGRYKLLQRIGEGGCGVVYMAKQEEPVRRRVALKIIKLGMDTRQVIARFEAERQALALMDHPNIAKVLDAGATETGRPYFVMELVRGIKITEYCDQRRFTTRQRLELFIQVCQAVQHAHQKGIIHRDIKPSNILVTEQDGRPVPKIIDFGIAKATAGQPLTDKTLFTAFEQFIGTPAYMSPEQAGLGKLDVDTRSDIYSLGVLLYELLTGCPPFDSAELRRSAIDEVLRTIRETEPPRPSGKVTMFSEQELTVTAQQRQTEPVKLARILRGDLDWIVMKAMEKDRSRRYETADGLVRDVECHLKDETVAARPPSVAYLLSKFLRRHQQAITVAMVITVTILAGVIVSTREHAEKRRASERASEESELLELKTSVQRASDNMKWQEAESNGWAYVALQEKVSGRESMAVADALSDLGAVLLLNGNDAEADLVLGRALTIRRKWLKPNDPEIARLLGELANLADNRGRVDEAESYYSQQLAILTNRTDTSELALTKLDMAEIGLGAIKEEKGELQAAEDLYRSALVNEQLFAGTNSLKSIGALQKLANVLELEDKLPESEEYCRQYLERLRSNLPPDHPMVGSACGLYASILLREHDFVRAQDAASNCLSGWEQRMPDDWRAFNARSLLGGSLLGQKQYAAAENLLLTGFDGMKRREETIPPAQKVRLKEALIRVVTLYEETTNSERATHWKQELAAFERSNPEITSTNKALRQP